MTPDQKKALVDALYKYIMSDFGSIDDMKKENFNDVVKQCVLEATTEDTNPSKIDKATLNRLGKRDVKKALRKAVDGDSISLVHPVCCGIDVHKDNMVACLRTLTESGERQEEIREFSGFTDDLISLRDWLLDNNCPIVALESTGVYWRALHNILEDHLNVILVNARHFKNVPGRKTDIKDSKWLAELLQYGLLRGSFIPAKEVRDWRDLSRLRKKLTKDLGNYKRRVHKVFETANIKIDSVATDLFGVTGRNLINYLCSGKKLTLEGVLKRTKGRLRTKVDELYRSIQGFFRDHHRFEVLSQLRIIAVLETEIEEITSRLGSLMKDHGELLERLDEVPGIDIVSAQSILAELGYDLSSFANENYLSSWAGVSPGNNQSAGKRFSGRSPVRKHPFKEVLVEIAWSAMKKKGSYYKTKYYKLKSKRGAKKAIVAIAHRILKAIYFIIKDGAKYKELGGKYLEEKRKKKNLDFLEKQAKKLGFKLIAA